MTPSTSKKIIRHGRVFPEIQWTEKRKAQEKARRQAFHDLCWTIFETLKPELLDKYYGWYIAIEPDSGNYYSNSHNDEAQRRNSNPLLLRNRCTSLFR